MNTAMLAIVVTVYLSIAHKERCINVVFSIFSAKSAVKFAALLKNQRGDIHSCLSGAYIAYILHCTACFRKSRWSNKQPHCHSRLCWLWKKNRSNIAPKYFKLAFFSHDGV